MKPRLLINGWFWGQTTTGSGQYLHGLLRHLPEALPGWRLTLALPVTPVYRKLPPAPARVDVAYFRLPAYARGARLLKLSWEQHVFPKGCKQLAAKVAFTPYWGSPIRPPCPAIVTIHDLIPLLLPDYATKVTARAYTWLVSVSARRAAAVLTVSQSAHDDIVEHLRIPADRVHIAYESLGYPHAPVTDASTLAAVRARYDLPEHFLFFLGGFDPRKQVPFLIKAYAHARASRPDIPPLLIAGKLPDPNDHWFTDPRPVIAELGLGDVVRTLGFVPDADKPALYSQTDLFLFPSRYEGFGLPPLEAMACGAPALVSNVSSLPEVVGQTLPPAPIDSVQAYAQAILEALARPPAPEALLAQAARFTWEDTAARVAEIVRRQSK